MNTLDKIFEYKKLELEHRRRKVSEKDLQKKDIQEKDVNATLKLFKHNF